MNRSSMVLQWHLLGWKGPGQTGHDERTDSGERKERAKLVDFTERIPFSEEKEKDILGNLVFL